MYFNFFIYKYCNKVELKHGKNTFNYPNGDKYEGDWLDNKRHGRGIFYLANEPFKGDKYDGDWQNDKQHGVTLT